MEPGRQTFTLIRQYGYEIYNEAKQLCETSEKLATAKEQLTFNIKCKRNKVLPKSLRFKPPIKNHELRHIVFNTEFQYLECYIRDDHRRIKDHEAKISRIKLFLSMNQPSNLFDFIKEVAEQKFQRHRQKIKQSLISKYNAFHTSYYNTTSCAAR